MKNIKKQWKRRGTFKSSGSKTKRKKIEILIYYYDFIIKVDPFLSRDRDHPVHRFKLRTPRDGEKRQDLFYNKALINYILLIGRFRTQRF